MQSGTGQTIMAAQAVWSCQEGGFFVPTGHMVGDREVSDPAFYDIMPSGELSRRNQTVLVDYADPLETKETGPPGLGHGIA